MVSWTNTIDFKNESYSTKRMLIVISDNDCNIIISIETKILLV